MTADDVPLRLPARSARTPSGRPGRGLLSVVIPCHNEESVVEATHARLVRVLPETGMDFEIIYVDDGSRDATLARLESIATRDPRACVVELSRNFGQQAAMSAGLGIARGDAVVIIDADLQDPPEVIPEMVDRWRGGVDVAFGQRRSREGETAFKLVTASLFHRFFASLMPYPVPIDTGDFKLLDRAVVDAVASLPEKRRYLRSLVPWAGFRQEAVFYDRHARLAGETKYSARRLLGLAFDAVMISSDKPLRLTWAGVAALALVGLVAGATAWTRSSAGSSGISLASLVAVACLVATIPTAAIAIVGEYVVRAYREAQGRPTWVVRRTLNAPAADRSIDSARAA